MAPYGGPVQPGIAVGGFPTPRSGDGPDFKLATGIILTFLVNNHQKKSLLTPAMKWEWEFVQFLKNFSSDDLDIAFSAERSIQDGIEELSEAEASTVLISYGVMFLYVAIALGKIKSFRYFLVS